MTALPKVSVIIPAYNAERFLGEALDSVLAQTFRDWIAAIVDDGSSDGTVALADAYARRDPRFRVVRQSNQGVSAARNRAMASFPAEYFAFLDADDIWLPEKLEHQLAAAQQHEVGFVFCAHEQFSTIPGTFKIQRLAGGLVGPVANDRLLQAVAAHGFTVPSLVMVKAEMIEALGGFDETLRNSEDWDLWWRIALTGQAAYGCPDVLARYRIDHGSLSSNPEQTFWSNMIVFNRYLTLNLIPARQARNQIRLTLRNCFTLAGDQGRFDQVFEMFDAYRPLDICGYACRIMGILRRWLPAKPFWAISRYFVIPLAWHLESCGEKLFGDPA